MNNQNKLVDSINIYIKLILGSLLLCFGTPFLFVAFITIFLKFSNPNFQKSQELIMLIAKHRPDGQLIYSKSDGYLSSSLCFVYIYPEGNYKNYSELEARYNYSNQNKNYDSF